MSAYPSVKGGRAGGEVEIYLRAWKDPTLDGDFNNRGWNDPIDVYDWCRRTNIDLKHIRQVSMATGRRLGGPLLCLGDLLNDLSKDDDDDSLIHSNTQSDSSTSQRPQTLHEVFERNYNELNMALTNSDHTWTGLTQKVCAALKTADKLVQSAHEDLGLLSEKLKALQDVLQRGDIALSKLKISE